MSQGFTILFYGFIFIFSISFFFFTYFYYKKLAQYFIHEVFRTFPAVSYLTLKIPIRAILKGAIHSFLHYNYFWEMISLILIEIFVILFGILAQIKYKIYLTKTHWIFYMLYHLNFIFINFLLLVEEKSKQNYK